MIAMFASLLVAAASPAPLPGSIAACPRAEARIIQDSNFTMPDNARPTRSRVWFALDIGSDGRVRRSAMVESSGDAAVDELAAKAVAEWRFAPQTGACMSTSTAWSHGWEMPAESIASPAPPGAVSLPCAAPFVRVTRFPVPRRREPPGTAAIDIVLDATARVTGVHLARSSGNTKADYFAAILGRNATYVFERQPGCTPTATTYRRELTFH